MSLLTDAGMRGLGGGRYAATLPSGWASMVGIHGGYVAALAASAVEDVVGEEGRALRSVSAQFLRPPSAGAIEVDVDVVQAGRSVSFLRATVRQDGRPVVVVSAVAGHPRGGLEFDEVARPRWAGRPPPDEAGRFTGPNPGEHFEQLDLRLEPGLALFGGNDVARVAAWVRPLDPEAPLTVPWLVLATDVMPPSMVFRTDRPVQAASIELAVQVLHGRPDALVAPGQHLFGEMRAWASAEGFTIEDGTFWSPAGDLLATSRQLRLAGT